MLRPRRRLVGRSGTCATWAATPHARPRTAARPGQPSSSHTAHTFTPQTSLHPYPPCAPHSNPRHPYPKKASRELASAARSSSATRIRSSASPRSAPRSLPRTRVAPARSAQGRLVAALGARDVGAGKYPTNSTARRHSPQLGSPDPARPLQCTRSPARTREGRGGGSPHKEERACSPRRGRMRAAHRRAEERSFTSHSSRSRSSSALSTRCTNPAHVRHERAQERRGWAGKEGGEEKVGYLRAADSAYQGTE